MVGGGAGMKLSCLAKRKVATRTILKVMLSALDNAEFPSPRQS